MISREQRKEAYHNASLIAKQLYEAPESGAMLRKIFNTQGLPKEKYPDYVELIGDVIIGLSPKSDLPARLGTTLTIDNSSLMRLVADIFDFLKPLDSSVVNAATATKPLHQEIAETEAALARVAPVRTMARDMHDLESQAPAEAPAYRSEQPSVTNTTAPAAPRWDSEKRP